MVKSLGRPVVGSLDLLGLFWSLLLELLDMVKHPCLVEHRLFRAVEAQERKPRLAGRGVNPAGFFASRSDRSELDVYRNPSAFSEPHQSGDAVARQVRPRPTVCPHVTRPLWLCGVPSSGPVRSNFTGFPRSPCVSLSVAA